MHGIQSPCKVAYEPAIGSFLHPPLTNPGGLTLSGIITFAARFSHSIIYYLLVVPWCHLPELCSYYS